MKPKTKTKKLYTAEYVVQDCPIMGKIIVKHYLPNTKKDENNR